MGFAIFYLLAALIVGTLMGVKAAEGECLTYGLFIGVCTGIIWPITLLACAFIEAVDRASNAN